MRVERHRSGRDNLVGEKGKLECKRKSNYREREGQFKAVKKGKLECKRRHTTVKEETSAPTMRTTEQYLSIYEIYIE